MFRDMCSVRGEAGDRSREPRHIKVNQLIWGSERNGCACIVLGGIREFPDHAAFREKGVITDILLFEPM